jgi:hypothetical protein
MEQSPSSEADQFSQLTKKILAFYGTRRFFTVLTSARHLSLSWAYSIQSPRPPPTSWRSILSSSSSFPRLLPRLPVTSIPPFTFPSIPCHRRQFLHKMWPIQLAFRLLISCRIFLCSFTVSNTSPFLTWSLQLTFSILLQHHISKLSTCIWSIYYWLLFQKVKFGPIPGQSVVSTPVIYVATVTWLIAVSPAHPPTYSPDR